MRRKRALALMSGGVDSSVGAYLLKEAGYDVVGVTMKLLPCEVSDDFRERDRSCCSLDDLHDAKNIAGKIGIPHYTLNLEDEFKREVIDYFCNDYINGRTPNPCVVCNSRIKFGKVLNIAKSLNAEFVATGHYARIEKKSEVKYLLKKGIDRDKDQSYFLYGLNQRNLPYTLFPVGDLKKSDVRKIAKRLGLNISSKPDSQDICFIENTNYRGFIKTRVKTNIKEGKIIDKKGKILGDHGGIMFYTIGQRKGLNISHGKPMYVLKIDIDNNAIVIGEKKDTYARKCEAILVNWISKDGFTFPLKVKAKIRYKHNEQNATIKDGDDSRIFIEFENPQSSITPGQSIVFYDGDAVLGGGIIDKVVN